MQVQIPRCIPQIPVSHFLCSLSAVFEVKLVVSFAPAAVRLAANKAHMNTVYDHKASAGLARSSVCVCIL